LIGSEKSDTSQKMVAGQPEPDPQKKKVKSVQPMAWSAVHCLFTVFTVCYCHLQNLTTKFALNAQRH
jgi:hypothetical protein